ncbi:MAG TPA: PAS domain S-box protein [Anaerolineales bacterium]|nr:PAS domain S-box protein [Anaerolineales bacterium]
MNFEYTPYSLLLIATALASMWAVFHVWPRRESRNALVLIIMGVAAAIWSAGYALEIAGADLSTKVFWGKIQYFGIVLIPGAWLFFAVSHANPSFAWTPGKIWALSIMPAITLLLASTTEMHGLVWKEYGIFREGGFSALEIVHGMWFWVFWAYSQLLILAGTLITIRVLVRTRGAFRGQAVALLLAVLAPWIGNILYISHLNPFPRLDLTPFSFAFSVVAIVWAIYGFRLMDIAPVARDLILDGMSDGMIVLDLSNRVVDINKAACRLIGLSESYAIGKRIEELSRTWSHVLEQFGDATEAKGKVFIGSGEAKRRYEIGGVPLKNRQGFALGRVITMHEIASPPASASESDFALAEPSAQPTAGTYTQPVVERRQYSNPMLDWIVDFFIVPPQTDMKTQPGENLGWYRARERALTTIARIVALLGGAVFLLNVLYTTEDISTPLILAYGLVFALVWYVGLVRSAGYRLRMTMLLAALYFLALAKVINYGYVAGSFTFFMTFFAATAVLSSPRGSMIAFFFGLTTLGVFGWLIGGEIITPLVSVGYANPALITLKSGVISLSEFFVNASVIIASGTFLVKDLNRAWQIEAQSLNLVQQERDLLEQRVKERTRDLVVARDQSEKNARELRKYYLAIEQSGNSIIITDANGVIEYVNPSFVALTGYAPEEAIGRTSRILKSGEHERLFYEDMWKTISSGRVWYGKLHNRRKDGSLYWESATITPVQNRLGEVVNYIAIKEDITDQKYLQDQLTQQNNYLSILHQVTLDLLHRRDIKSLLKVIVDYAAILMDAPFGELMLEENGILVVQAFTSDQFYQQGERVAREEARLSWQAFDTQQPVVLEDYSTWENRLSVYGDDLYACTALPIMAGDHCLGVLEVGRSQKGYTFTAEQVQTGILFSRLVALVLDNANLYASAKKEIAERERLEEVLMNQNHYLGILQKIMFTLLQSADETSLLNDIVEQAVDILNATYGYIYISEGDDLVLQAATAEFASMIGARENKNGEGILGRIWQTMRILTVDDYGEWAERDPAYSKWELHALVGTALIGRNGPFGALIVARARENALPFTPQEIDVFGQFAALASLVLDNSQLYEQSQRELAERQRTEVLLRESEARFRQIVENAGDIIYRADPKGNLIYVNPTALAIMGYQNEDEVLGKNYLDVTIPEWRQKLKRFYRSQFLSGETSSYFEFPAVTAHGEIIWLGQNVQIIKEEGEIVGFQAVARDITKLKQMQEALAVSRDQALDASRFKSQLLSRVSHELRTPLSGILGYAELLEYKAFGALNEGQQNAVTNIIEGTNYLTSIVNDLLDEAQIQSKSISLHYEHFKPARLLENIKTSISVLANRKGLQFRAELAPDLPDELYGDFNRLQQIIINLAGNAVKFTKEGEVRVNIHRAQPAHWSIEVCDTGAGIPLTERETIFEPFRQVNNAITRENRGSGLGLAITKQLIELMGGRIALESEVGKGSTFTVTLPINTAPEN